MVLRARLITLIGSKYTEGKGLNLPKSKAKEQAHGKLHESILFIAAFDPQSSGPGQISYDRGSLQSRREKKCPTLNQSPNYKTVFAVPLKLHLIAQLLRTFVESSSGDAKICKRIQATSATFSESAGRHINFDLDLWRCKSGKMITYRCRGRGFMLQGQILSMTSDVKFILYDPDNVPASS